MATGRTMLRPKVPTLKGTEVSLSYIQYFLYLVSSLINVSLFHIAWLDTFWTDFIIYHPYYYLGMIRPRDQEKIVTEKMVNYA